MAHDRDSKPTTTHEDKLQAAIKAENLTQKFDFVTLLIGVNNQYRGYSKVIYRKEFKELLQTAINFAGGNSKKVFVVYIINFLYIVFMKEFFSF